MGEGVGDARALEGAQLASELPKGVPVVLPCARGGGGVPRAGAQGAQLVQASGGGAGERKVAAGEHGLELVERPQVEGAAHAHRVLVEVPGAVADLDPRALDLLKRGGELAVPTGIEHELAPPQGELAAAGDLSRLDQLGGQRVELGAVESTHQSNTLGVGPKQQPGTVLVGGPGEPGGRHAAHGVQRQPALLSASEHGDDAAPVQRLGEPRPHARVDLELGRRREQRRQPLRHGWIGEYDPGLALALGAGQRPHAREQLGCTPREHDVKRRAGPTARALAHSGLGSARLRSRARRSARVLEEHRTSLHVLARGDQGEQPLAHSVRKGDRAPSELRDVPHGLISA